MPCWYFERKEIRNSPSYLDGIEQATENRYRREGARLILDAGTKLGLRYDTCATGVTYFHRFYMAHSFREFHRYVMSACCLFLAGKVEETPKKCKDIIRTVQLLLSPEGFQAFGDDPREEVMTMERILLQTIKFDLQVEHPYGFLLSFAKQIKGDKEKIQKMAQMSWTFINDSLCTTLCLQWESEIIAVSLMYLASRLTKFEPTDWNGRVSGSKAKWWEDLIEGMSMELMEDICHQVLDLYSAQQQAQKQDGREASPPMSTGPRGPRPTGPRDTPPPPPRDPPPPPKRNRMESPADSLLTASKAKKGKAEREDVPTKQSTPAASSAPSSKRTSPNLKAGPSGGSGPAGQMQAAPINPYVSSSMYSSSFMSQEGQQSIQSLLGGNTTATVPPPQQYPSYPLPPPRVSTPRPLAPTPQGVTRVEAWGTQQRLGSTMPRPLTRGLTTSLTARPPPSPTPPPPRLSAPPPPQTTSPLPPRTALPRPTCALPRRATPTLPPWHSRPLLDLHPPTHPPGFGAPPPGGYSAPPPLIPHRGRGAGPTRVIWLLSAASPTEVE